MANCLIFIMIGAQLCSVIVGDSSFLSTDLLLDTYPPEDSNSSKAELTSGEGDRTLITISILRWLTNILKAMIKPVRDIYIALGPEISVMKCLSDTRSSRQPVWYDFENGLDQESPRVNTENMDSPYGPNSMTDRQTSDDRILRRIPRFVDEVATVFKNENSMGCILPYMKERIFRWLDS